MAEPGLMFRDRKAEATLDEKADYQPTATDLEKEFAKAKSKYLSAEALKRIQEEREKGHRQRMKLFVEEALSAGNSYKDLGLSREELIRLGIVKNSAREKTSGLENKIRQETRRNKNQTDNDRYKPLFPLDNSWRNKDPSEVNPNELFKTSVERVTEEFVRTEELDDYKKRLLSEAQLLNAERFVQALGYNHKKNKKISLNLQEIIGCIIDYGLCENSEDAKTVLDILKRKHIKIYSRTLHSRKIKYDCVELREYINASSGERMYKVHPTLLYWHPDNTHPFGAEPEGYAKTSYDDDYAPFE